ncbi:glycosyltransferase family 9 protein [Synechococcus sp. A15-60]|uniref:glycosyltransferase family 9 protein n=1 Tax=Synechococcus sp. A15-60 TaxID=1050655 RepID=UPI00164607F9|nr:glycosyltransferase family 9 protein [Synechococcus sp. A15-60]QNI46819.1 conserved hypothetical protein distantly related to glycosyltransferases/ family 9 [Synechococcus sp. A15-60]
MQRYAGESLGDSPRIVVLGSCKVGNFVVSTPLLRGLKERWPDATMDFIGSAVTADFESNCPWIDWRCSWDSREASAGLDLLQTLEQRQNQCGPVSLAINLDGFNPVTQVVASWLRPLFIAGGTLTNDLRRTFPWGDLPQQRFLEEPDWDSPAFLKRHSSWLSTNSISELFCRLAWIDTDVHAIALSSTAPNFSVPDVLIHCTTARAAKVWPFAHWRSVIDACNHRDLSVGLVGSPPKAQQEAYNAGDGEDWLLQTTALIDLRGQTTLMELAGACRQTAAVVSVDAGPMHIAAAVGTPTLALVGNDADGTGASPIRLWLPRTRNLSRTVSPHSCDRCASNRFRNDGCLVEGHPCMSDVLPEQVIDWLSAVPGLQERWYAH